MKTICVVAFVLSLFAGCVLHTGATSSERTLSASSPKQDIETLTLQYRISRDAVAPSQFVALYDSGMTPGLRIHWKIEEAKKKKLDELLGQLEKDGVNGREFIAKAKWIHEGFELEVYGIEKKF